MSVVSDRLWNVMNDIEESMVRLSSVRDLLNVAVRRNSGDFDSVCNLITAIDLLDDIEGDFRDKFMSAFDVVMEAGSTIESVSVNLDGEVGLDVVSDYLPDEPYSLDEETYNQMVREYDNHVVSFG